MTHEDSSQAVSPLFAGIDVAKDKLDLARSDSGEQLTFPNDAQGIARLVGSFDSMRPKCIVVTPERDCSPGAKIS